MILTKPNLKIQKLLEQYKEKQLKGQISKHYQKNNREKVLK